jgi:uncharacterized protein with gpF-like domain
MALNTNKQQVKKSAARDHAKKLLFESQILPPLHKEFNGMADYFHSTYSKTGTQPDVTQHTLDVKKILQNHYDKVSDSFSQQIVNELGKPDNHGQVQQDTEMSKEIHKTISADQSAQYIGQTTQNNMSDSVKKVVIAAAAAGLFLTNRQIANRAKIELKKKFADRTPLIAMVETQRPAENAKQAEYEALAANDSIAGETDFSTDNKTKEWVAILDNVTRDAHAVADGQVQPFDQPYIVMNEKLMFPGDTSLGASMANIANCRCSSVPVVS